MITTINEWKIFERKNIGILYHFTALKNLNDITKNNTELKPCLKPAIDDYFDNKQYSISTTRKYNFIWESIRFTLDGTLISSNYKIKPLEFFNQRDIIDYNYNHKDVNKELIRQGKQFEERIILRENDKLDLKKYCLSVDISTDEIYDSGHGGTINAENFMQIKPYFESLNIPCNLVKNFKPYK